MKVTHLKMFLSNLTPLLQASKASNTVLNNLETLENALAPFADMELGEFSAIVSAAQEYKRTGNIQYIQPAKKKKPTAKKATPKKPKLSNDEKKNRAIEAIRNVNDSLKSLSFDEIEEQVEKILRQDNASIRILEQIGDEFGAPRNKSMKKDQLIECIARHFSSRKASMGRIANIS